MECCNIPITYTNKVKFPKELFSLKNFYNSKQSRIRKLAPFIYSQNSHRLLAMLVSSLHFSLILCYSQNKRQDSRCQCPPCVHIIVKVLQFDEWRSRIKEFVELDLELVLYKKSMYMNR